MSEQNVEIARRVMAAVTRRDLPELLELTDPQVEWHSFFAALVAGGSYHGHEGMRQYIADLHDAFEAISPNIDGLLAVGEVVIGVGHVHYRGRGSGIESAPPTAWVFKFRAGRVVLFRALREPEKELGALGEPR